VLVTLLILFLIRKLLIASQLTSLHFRKHRALVFLFLLVPLAGYFLVNNNWKNISKNNYVNELVGNGTYEFGAAFWNNELDYNRIYQFNNDTAHIKILPT
jgi:hypothetical protein